MDALLREHNIAQLSEISNALRYAMACVALPTCGLALSDAERALPLVVRGLEREIARLGLEQEKIWIRMVGCPNGCARPYLGDLGFVGRSLNAYNVYVGGDFECLLSGSAARFGDRLFDCRKSSALHAENAVDFERRLFASDWG